MYIHLIPKWPLFRYSFVFIQIRPWCLVHGKYSFEFSAQWTRHQGLIWIKTREYLNDGHFGIRSITFKYLWRMKDHKDRYSYDSKDHGILTEIINILIDCLYEGKLHRHGDAWSPGPCIPECRCKSGHVKCSKIECPDLNCERPTKRKWKCCPECSPETQDGLYKSLFEFPWLNV